MTFGMLVIGPEKNEMSIDLLAQRNILAGNTLLDTLDDPECNLGDPISHFLPNCPDMDVTGVAGGG